MKPSEEIKKQKYREIRSAIKLGAVEHVASLIREDPSLPSVRTTSGTWLHDAADKGQIEIVKLLVANGADVNARGDTFDGNALNIAAAAGHTEIAAYLLSCGAQMDVGEPERNPLFGAIFGGHLDVVKLLVENGIDFRVKYSGRHMKNMNAWAFADERGEGEIAHYLASLDRA